MRNYKTPREIKSKDSHIVKYLKRGRTPKDTSKATKTFRVNRQKGNFKGGRGK